MNTRKPTKFGSRNKQPAAAVRPRFDKAIVNGLLHAAGTCANAIRAVGFPQVAMKAAKVITLLALVAGLAAILLWQFRTLQRRSLVEIEHHEIVTTNAVTPAVQPRTPRGRSTPVGEAEQQAVVPETSTVEPVSTPGQQEVPPVRPVPPPTRSPVEQGARSVGGASGAVIAGKVFFRGTPLRRPKIMFDAEPNCAAMHAEPVLAEDVIVNDDGTLRNVFVYVKQGLEGATFPAPTESVVIEQRGCLYHPHVFGMQAGQPLLIRNGDNTLHNIHATPKNPGNKEFNLGQPNKGMQTRRTFAVPEVMIHFKCDVHPWMSAYVGVLDHPYFAVTSDGGTFALPAPPPGEYVLAAWHEVYGELTQAVTVTGAEAQAINFTFSP